VIFIIASVPINTPSASVTVFSVQPVDTRQIRHSGGRATAMIRQVPPNAAPRGPLFARVTFTGVEACGPGVATWAT
jgi:hypothetical protein